MSTVMVRCSECGQMKPTQKVVCAKHDFAHDPDKHCDHCEDELAKQFLDNVEKQLDADKDKNSADTSDNT
jgi:hypothetical protein